MTRIDFIKQQYAYGNLTKKEAKMLLKRLEKQASDDAEQTTDPRLYLYYKRVAADAAAAVQSIS